MLSAIAAAWAMVIVPATGSPSARIYLASLTLTGAGSAPHVAPPAPATGMLDFSTAISGNPLLTLIR